MRPVSAANKNPDRRRDQFAFTMIEIALCLAIIGFGLVAIIGVLPTGLNVQKDNRQETIIDQDASVWMDAVRSGAMGYDDLTNYVIGISNYWTTFDSDTNRLASGVDRYDRTGSMLPAYPLTNGFSIIGVLSTPKWVKLRRTDRRGAFQSNYVWGVVRAISGSAVEKAPQDNQTILDNAFAYRMIVEIVPYVPFDAYATNFAFTPTNEAVARMRVLHALQKNSSDLRLTFRWPLLPTGEPGNGRQTFRSFTGGQTVNLPAGSPFYFLQPSTYLQ